MAAALLAKIKNTGGQAAEENEQTAEALKVDMLLTKSSFLKWMPMDRCQKRHLRLFPSSLECYGDSSGVKYAKGVAPLKDLKVLEPADDEVLDMPFTFQVVYEKDQEQNVWYFACHFRKQQDDWIKEIRKAAMAENASFWEKYHPGAWKKEQWSCCMKVSKDAMGCKDATVTGHQGPRLPKPNIRVPKKVQPSREERPTEANVRKNNKKTVVAIADYSKHEEGELELRRGEEFTVVEDEHDVWWRLKSQTGEIGSAPRELLSADLHEESDLQSAGQQLAHVVKEDFGKNNGSKPKPAPRGPLASRSNEDLKLYDWFFGSPPRELVAPILKSNRTDGCFLVRESSTSGGYVISVFSAKTDEVKHYKVKKDNKMFHFNDYYKFEKLSELIEHHKKKQSGLETLLTVVPIDKGLIDGFWIIDESQLIKGDKIGKGFFSDVYKGTLTDGMKSEIVAIKTMEFARDSAVDVIREISTMAQLSHPNLVSLHGISFEPDHINIVTEYLSQGDLRHYLEKQQGVLKHQLHKLINMLIEVNLAMCYLEKQNIIHRDLAARNCLVGSSENVKVCDFGLSRFVEEGFYESQNSSMPLKWCSPEVLESSIFSSKSDVWSFGVLAWEVYSFGTRPYNHLNTGELIREVVRNNYRLPKPEFCPHDVDQIIRRCWEKNPSYRPSFIELLDMLKNIQE